jgi:hypothetical protein
VDVPIAGFTDSGDLVIEGEVTVEEDSKVACIVDRLYDSVGIDLKSRVIDFGKLGGVAEDKEFSFGWVER